MNKIKLVIWDLDETFWRGTLSEEGIEIIEDNIKIVKELTSRGIINSIVSKNDFEKAKVKLEELNIWEYFIFPAIEWSPKGLLIKEIIENCQLRDINVLFIDDNHLNLEEAKYYNPNINTALPYLINELLDNPEFEGKNDINHSRLKQYKILEQKQIAKKGFSNNIEFLKSSNISIRFIKEIDLHLNRVYELLERTNQLNYTKKRLSNSEISKLINNENLESQLIQVTDKYGDYGIVGFYSLNKATHKLEHFLFSCRILNLGIAQYVYAKLGFPKLEIIPEVAEKLNNSPMPSWIMETLVDTNLKDQKEAKKHLKVLFKGGCDLQQMIYYLANTNLQIIEETNYVSKKGLAIHQEHSQILLDALEMNSENKKYLEENVPFVDSEFYKTSFFNSDYDCLVYSVLMDYTQDLYEHKNRNIRLPYGGYYHVLTNETEHQDILQKYLSKGVDVVSQKDLTFFADEFIHIGQISSETFLSNLAKIRGKVLKKIPIIFINGAEIKFPNEKEEKALERHKEMNKALDTFVKNSENTFLVDIRSIILNSSQLTNGIRHYNRETYKKISIELLKLLNELFDSNIKQRKNLTSLIKNKLLNAFKM